MKLLTIIVNYRTAESALLAAEAWMRATLKLPEARLVIVDNQSDDGSFERLTRERSTRGLAERAWIDRVELLASDRNGGFGYGNNLALRRNLASADPAEFFYLLNPDAFPEPDAIERLLAFLEGHPEVGIAGSFVNEPGHIPHESAFRFHTWLSELENGVAFRPISWLLADWIVAMPVPTETCRVGWVGGASMMIRRSVLEKVGLFDERFFLYFEETDLCRRAADAGFPSYFVKDSVVTHVGGASTGMTNSRKKPIPSYWFESRNHYFDKHHGRLYRYAASLAWASGRVFLQARYAIQGREDRFPQRFLWDFCRHSFFPASRKSG
jgi:N-acetylglucosaminyl-diphospho-decaprenol L-rhamnosyltransferase